jgi:predicted PolB exonuclease-like 3'-5' exonuclease
MKILFFDIETVPTERSLLDSGVVQAESNEADLLKALSLSATTAKILCLGYAIDPPGDSPVHVLEGDEKTILESFWKLSLEIDLFVGHNIVDFDLRFIWQRSIVNQLRPSREIPLARQRCEPIFDTMQEWSHWGREHVSLDKLAKALGIASPKDSLDGSKVYTHYRDGKLYEICEYCKRDVDTVRQVYRRLTFTLGNR